MSKVWIVSSVGVPVMDAWDYSVNNWLYHRRSKAETRVKELIEEQLNAIADKIDPVEFEQLRFAVWDKYTEFIDNVEGDYFDLRIEYPSNDFCDITISLEEVE